MNNLNNKLPLLGFGAMGISEFYGKTDEKLAYETINMALKHNISHFDTADGYDFGNNERFLKKALNLTKTDNRQNLIIASKAGIMRDQSDPTVRGICIKPDYLRNQLYKSLNNLGTDYLDIFYIHRLPPEATEGELNDLSNFLLSIKKEKVVKFVGLSEPKLNQLKNIHHHCPIDFVQSEYSLLERVVEKNGILTFCRNSNINFVAYSPLCRGMLTDTFDPATLDKTDFRLTLPKFTGENYIKNTAIVNQLKKIAKTKNISLSCLAIAWLVHQNVIAIPGMRKASRVIDAIAALDISLSPNDLKNIDDIAFIGASQGTRYSLAAMDAYGFE